MKITRQEWHCRFASAIDVLRDGCDRAAVVHSEAASEIEAVVARAIVLLPLPERRIAERRFFHKDQQCSQNS